MMMMMMMMTTTMSTAEGWGLEPHRKWEGSSSLRLGENLIPPGIKSRPLKMFTKHKEYILTPKGSSFIPLYLTKQPLNH